ncbi:hypothetical protein KBC54_04725 [Patescibacteria group bacterium]|nr:hypothetical protein [Patescibacteria group bacterium]
MPENGESSRFTPGELKVASWWTRNQIMVRRVGRGVLIGIAVLLWGYSFWGLLDAFAISYPRESRITRDIAVNQQRLVALETDRPQNVSLSQVSVLQTTENRFDMMVEASNPNAQWWAEFNYRFNLSGEETPMRAGYILPGSTQVLTELGYKPTQKGGRIAVLEVENIRWHRVDPAQVGPEYPAYAKKRMALDFQDIKYDTDIVIGTSRVGQTSFTVVNDTGFGFWSVDLIVRLYRGSSFVDINKISLDHLAPGERRPIQMTWFDNLPSVTKTEIIPQVNILNPKVFLPTEYFAQ